jgi:hypothetical protein
MNGPFFQYPLRGMSVFGVGTILKGINLTVQIYIKILFLGRYPDRGGQISQAMENSMEKIPSPV